MWRIWARSLRVHRILIRYTVDFKYKTVGGKTGYWPEFYIPYDTENDRYIYIETADDDQLKTDFPAPGSIGNINVENKRAEQIPENVNLNLELNLDKVSAIPSMTSRNYGYSLGGAEFRIKCVGVDGDAVGANRDDSFSKPFTTTSDGSGTITVKDLVVGNESLKNTDTATPAGEPEKTTKKATFHYQVQETQAPKGYEVNKDVRDLYIVVEETKTVTHYDGAPDETLYSYTMYDRDNPNEKVVASNKDATLSIDWTGEKAVKETPVYGHFGLEKLDVTGVDFNKEAPYDGLKVSTPQGDGTLEGAIFKLTFTEPRPVYRLRRAHAFGRTWYIKTDKKGIAKLDKEHLVTEEPYKSDAVFTDAEGNYIVPLGEIVWEEVKAPEGYDIPRHHKGYYYIEADYVPEAEPVNGEIVEGYKLREWLYSDSPFESALNRSDMRPAGDAVKPFGIELHKHSGKTPLAGATFNIYNYSEGNDSGYGQANDGSIYLAEPGKTWPVELELSAKPFEVLAAEVNKWIPAFKGKEIDLDSMKPYLVDTITTDENGVAKTANNLPYGRYLVVETSTKNGKNMLSEPFVITLHGDCYTQPFSGGTKTAVDEVVSGEYYTLNVSNDKAPTLYTGGKGRTLIYLLAGIAVIAALILYRKKNK